MALVEIKKYPNRRLYHTTESRYITLADVRAAVMSRHTVYVREQKTGRDITCEVLWDVIAQDLETLDTETNTPRFSKDALLQIIRTDGPVHILDPAVVKELERLELSKDGLLELFRKMRPGKVAA